MYIAIFYAFTRLLSHKLCFASFGSCVHTYSRIHTPSSIQTPSSFSSPHLLIPLQSKQAHLNTSYCIASHHITPHPITSIFKKETKKECPDKINYDKNRHREMQKRPRTQKCSGVEISSGLVPHTLYCYGRACGHPAQGLCMYWDADRARWETGWFLGV